MGTERRYEPIKESRGWYYVEYQPPIRDYKFAMLNIQLVEDLPRRDLVTVMEEELENWLIRYPIPLFVSAFDNKGMYYNLNEKKPCNSLLGYINQDGKICMFWKLLKDEEIPNTALNREYLNSMFSNIPFRTEVDLLVEKQKRRQHLKLGWFIFFVWLTVIPALIAILEYYSNWLSLLALIYSLYKAIQKGLELTGKWPKSKRAKEQDIEERLKDHYYYHCQMNPEGFKKLMIENLERMEKEKITKEVASLEVKKG